MAFYCSWLLTPGSWLLASFQPQHILHVVQPWSLRSHPAGRAQCSVGKRVAAGSFVDQLQPLARAGENHRMIPDHVSAPNGMNADFFGRALTDNPGAPMPGYFINLLLSCLGQDLRQSSGRAARRIPFQAMVHLDNF